MSKRIAQNGYGFVIAAAPAADGRTLMVASQSVRDIEIKRTGDGELNVQQWGGSIVRSMPMSPDETTITASLAGQGRYDADHLVHLSVEQGGYAEAWRRLFDIWVPPQFTDETRSQILTHYTFGGM